MDTSSATPLVIQAFEYLKNNIDVANAITAMGGLVVASLAFLISVFSVRVASKTLGHQVRHNVLSLKPLPEIAFVDYEDKLWVKIRNNGSGPMIVRSLGAWDGSTSCNQLVDCMPDLPRGYWNHFAGDIAGRSMLPGAEICLLDLTEGDGEKGFARSRDMARDALARTTVTVIYTDVYETDFDPYIKKLDWFGRHKGALQ